MHAIVTTETSNRLVCESRVREKTFVFTWDREKKTSCIFAVWCCFTFEKRKTRRKRKKICVLYGEDAVIEHMCQRRFAKFRAGEFLSISSEHKRFYIRFPHINW